MSRRRLSLPDAVNNYSCSNKNLKKYALPVKLAAVTSVDDHNKVLYSSDIDIEGN